MGAITRKDVHVDAALSTAVIGYAPDMLEYQIVERLAPTVPMDKLSDKIHSFGLETFFGTTNTNPTGLDGARPEFSPYPGAQAESITQVTVTLEDYGWEEPLDKKTEDAQDAALDMADVKVRKCLGHVLRQDLQRVVDLLFDSSDMTTGATLTGTDQWDDYTASDPLGDLNTALESLVSSVGVAPGNALFDVCLAMADNTWNRLKIHPDVKSVHGGGDAAAKIASPDKLKEWFGFDDVVLIPSVKGNAAEGATASLTRIVGKHAVIFARPKNPDRFTGGAVLAFQNGTLESGWYQPHPKYRSFWVGHYRTEQVITAAAGYLITNAINA